MSDVFEDILDGNVRLVDNKYLIFYVLDYVDDEASANHKQIRTSCFGTVDAVCAVDDSSDSMSVSSVSSKL
ncbi:LEF-10 [Mocis latipes granulovirus]|uniref:LEF-10 n=1 Tax=Mocis latipes granulovirus TaxID=2072024 RepID=A0A2I6UI14_9BBAC|nr:LEF-10 [Mocis latipes granulovirus]AUO79645.1 LEF-10 [Mocis latipes granulovirus]